MSRLHSFAKASKTGSHSGGGGSSSFGTSWVARFAKVARNAATVFARSSFSSRINSTMSIRSLVLVLTRSPRDNVYACSFSANCCSAEITGKERRRHSPPPRPPLTPHHVPTAPDPFADTNDPHQPPALPSVQP